MSIEKKVKFFSHPGIPVLEVEPDQIPVHDLHCVHALHLLRGVHGVRPATVRLGVRALRYS